MPGIAGFVKIQNFSDAGSILTRMLDTLKSRADCRGVARIWEGEQCGLGAEVLRHINLKGCSSLTSRNGLIVDGDIFDDSDSHSLIDFLPEMLREENHISLADLRGAFSAVYVDFECNKLILCSDKFGTKPLYWAKVGGGIAFATEIKAFFCVPGVNKKPCERAYADFYRYGFAMEDRTLLEGIELVPPGTIIEFDLVTKKLKKLRYWNAVSLFVPVGEHSSDLDMRQVGEQFSVAVNRRMEGVGKLGVSLSGGLDSRAILAVMGDKAQGMTSYTLGLPGCEDERLTERLANVSGTHHEFLPLGKEYLSNFESMARALVVLSDGLYHPHESTEKRALDYFCTQPFDVVLRGHAGELAKASLAYPLAANSELQACKDNRQAAAYAYAKANLVLRDLTPQDIFSPQIAKAVDEGPRQSIIDVVSELPKGIAPEDICLFLYLTQWVRRQVLASLAIFRSQVEVRLPYLDEDFLKILLRVPVCDRWDGELQREVVLRNTPALAKIPNSNTGAPLDAGPLRLFVTDKVNSILRRLSFPGFRHYTEFDRWQREYFKTALEQILFDERTLSRGLYRREGLQSVFDAHISGKKNYAHMLGTVVGLEIWQREFID